MQALNAIGILLGSSWASGVNVYLTVAGLGISQRLGWIELPGNLKIISHLLVILVALFLYMIEFFADKIPLVDSMWDVVHTVIRPLGGAAIAYLAMTGAPAALQYSVALISGTVSLDSHLTKATTRLAINTSPEPVTNSIASVAEDGLVVGVLWLIIKHPFIAAFVVIAFIIFSVWFLRKMFRFVKKISRSLAGLERHPEMAARSL